MKVSSTVREYRMMRIIDFLHLACLDIERFFIKKGDPADALVYSYMAATLEVAKPYFYNDSGQPRATLKDSSELKAYNKTVEKVNQRALTINQIANYFRKLIGQIKKTLKK